MTTKFTPIQFSNHIPLSVVPQIGDKTGEAAAQMNLTDIKRSLGLPLEEDLPEEGAEERPASAIRRKSMEKMDLLKVMPRVGVMF